MWKHTNSKLKKFVKYGHDFKDDLLTYSQMSDLSYQQCFDILEAFAYTKKGSLKVISNTLHTL